MKTLAIDKEIKIRSVKKVWEKIDESDKPLKLNLKNFKKYDCAGFQFLLYLLKLERENPDNYKITGLSNEILESITSYGYNLEKGEYNFEKYGGKF